jgi:hypothetical protein
MDQRQMGARLGNLEHRVQVVTDRDQAMLMLSMHLS